MKRNKFSKIYHPSWEDFNGEKYLESASLFGKRLKINGFDLDWFKGKICLDAGCGSGRYVQAMLDLGAKKVVGMDLDTSIASAISHADLRVELIQEDINTIPFEDGHFDFVCCNGVIHHLEDSKRIVTELKRVLKKGGYLFLYVFDKHSRDWGIIDELREVAKKFPFKRMKQFFENLGLESNKVFALCDYMYIPIQKKFTREDLKILLKGFKIQYFSVPYTNYDRREENRLIARKC